MNSPSAPFSRASTDQLSFASAPYGLDFSTIWAFCRTIPLVFLLMLSCCGDRSRTEPNAGVSPTNRGHIGKTTILDSSILAVHPKPDASVADTGVVHSKKSADYLKRLERLTGIRPTFSCSSVDFNSTGDSIVAGYQDELHFWNVSTGRRLCSFRYSDAKIQDRVWVKGDGTVVALRRTWFELNVGKQPQMIHLNIITISRYAADGCKKIDEKTIKLPGTSETDRLCISQPLSFIISVNVLNKLEMIRLDKPIIKMVQYQPGNPRHDYCGVFCYPPFGIAALRCDGTLLLSNSTRTLTTIKRFNPQQARILRQTEIAGADSAFVFPRSNSLFLANSKHELALLDFRTLALIAKFNDTCRSISKYNDCGSIIDLDMSALGAVAFAFSSGDAVLIDKSLKGRATPLNTSKFKNATSLRFSPDGSKLAVGYISGDIVVFNVSKSGIRPRSQVRNGPTWDASVHKVLPRFP